MNGEEWQWPLPNPRDLPPSNPTPSHASEGIAGLGGRDRTWEFSHGRHGAFMNQGTRRPLPNPGFLPSSNPHPSKVGDGLITHRNGGGGGGGGGGAIRAGGEGPSMSFAQVLELLSKSSTSQSGSNSTYIPLQIKHPEITHPTQQLSIAHVWFFSSLTITSFETYIKYKSEQYF